MPHPVPGGWCPVAVLPRDTGITVGQTKSMHQISKPDFSRPRCAGAQTSPGLASAKWQSDESSSCLRSGSGLLGPSSNGTEILQDCPSKINRSTKAVVCLGKIESGGKSYQPNSHCSNPNSHELNHVKPMCLLVESPQIAI